MSFSKWIAQFDKQIQATRIISDKIQVESVKEFLKRVEERTPVGDPSLWHYPAPAGYKPGTLRASWTATLEQTTSGVNAIVANSQPYAERVEFGWSTQAPQGMLRITAKEWGGIVNSYAGIKS